MNASVSSIYTERLADVCCRRFATSEGSPGEVCENSHLRLAILVDSGLPPLLGFDSRPRELHCNRYCGQPQRLPCVAKASTENKHAGNFLLRRRRHSNCVQRQMLKELITRSETCLTFGADNHVGLGSLST